MVLLGKPVLHTMEHKHLAIHVGKKTGATTLLYNFWNKWIVSLAFSKKLDNTYRFLEQESHTSCQQEAGT
jgi:hypothetical protein